MDPLLLHFYFLLPSVSFRPSPNSLRWGGRPRVGARGQKRYLFFSFLAAGAILFLFRPWDAKIGMSGLLNPLAQLNSLALGLFFGGKQDWQDHAVFSSDCFCYLF